MQNGLLTWKCKLFMDAVRSELRIPALGNSPFAVLTGRFRHFAAANGMFSASIQATKENISAGGRIAKIAPIAQSLLARRPNKR